LYIFTRSRKTVSLMIIKLYDENPNPREINQVVSVLRDGGIVIYPTDTLYGMGCNALNVRAVERICGLKGINPQKSNLSIICNDMSAISEYAKVNTPTFKLMKRNLPGPFTFILPTTSSLPKIYKNKKTVGIRVPDNNIIREIVTQLGNPVLNTSVKIGDDEIEYSTDPELIHEKWGEIATVVIDGGIGDTEPSTVVDCTSDEPIIIRQGKGVLNL
jgi:tRNA threonylcarbamoyl adenosine modification protein (Sua5/YciO/YrdC/YwlC family)